MSNQHENVDKLYRFEILLQAIDFFTQKFTLDQSSEYAFNFANQILTLHSSALFIRKGDEYVQKLTHNYDIYNVIIPASQNLEDIAKFYGNVIRSRFDNFFDKDIIEKYDINIVIPLMIHDYVYGFIISNKKAGNGFNEDDYLLSNALMRLINNAMENSKLFSDLQETNKKLDRKIFNLFSIHHCSKVLFSELNLEVLYSLATDIFSEVTSSKITSFGLYDEISDKVIIRGYKNVTDYSKCYCEYQLHNRDYSGNKIVFHVRNDIDIIKKIFINWEDFDKVQADYIILIVNNGIQGFVTISQPTNESVYDESLFELIESLATSTCLSLTNAILFQQVSRQKEIIEHKFNILSKLNKLIKNINNCTDITELCMITLKTLNISFGIQKAFIALLDENYKLLIKDQIGFDISQPNIEYGDAWQEIGYNGTFFNYSHEANDKYFDHDLLEKVGLSNCLIISPITIEGLRLSDSSPILGYIVVLETAKSLREEEILLIDTISSNIAAVVNHMNTVDRIKKEYVVNQAEAFMNALKRKIFAKDHYYINFNIYYKRITKQLFVEPDLSEYSEYEYYYFDNILFVLSEQDIVEKVFDGAFQIQNQDEFYDRIKELSID